MKKIETIIHPQNWDHAKAALETLHVSATLREVKTFGRTPPRREVYRGSAYFLETTPELEMTVFVHDEQLESTLRALVEAMTDAQFLVTPVERVASAGDSSAVRPVPAVPRAIPSVRAGATPAFVAAMARG